MNLKELLDKYHEEIIRQWADCLQTKISERYSERPFDELFLNAKKVTEANYAVLVHEDFSKIDSMIEIISKLRLEGGFTLSEVQKAFEYYGRILLPMLFKELDRPLLEISMQKIDACVSYSIHRFSDYFDALHDKAIISHAENLEKEVEKRTRELVASESKYRVLVEEINDGYFVNQKGGIAFANKEFCDMHGYSAEEVIGRPLLDFVAPESLPEVRKISEQRLTTGKATEQYVYLRLCKDGTHRYTENKVQAITFQDEIAAAGICRDITERMETEKRRIRLVELESENKKIALDTLHQLMVTLSHYLLNSNTIIGGMVRRCRRLNSKEEIEASLDAIEEQAKKVEIVITALNQLTRIKTAPYTAESNTLMIDVTKEIEEALRKARETGTAIK
ncbi:MAG: PAS domain S-box protein [Syntrophobacteraceae bacterium]